MSIGILRTAFGVLSGVFALLLLGAPLARVAQQRLSLRRAVGLWISGAGFAFLSAAALVLEGGRAQNAVVLGVVVTGAGAVVQAALGRLSSSSRG